MALLKCTLREPMVSVESAKNANLSGNFGLTPEPKAVSTSQISTTKIEAESKETSRPGPQAKAENKTGPAVASDASEADLDHESVVVLDEIWPNFMKRIKAEKMSAASYLLEARPVEHTEDTVVIGFPKEFSFRAEALAVDVNLKLLEKHLSQLLNKTTRIKFILHDSSQDQQGEQSRQPADPEDPVETKPVLKSAVGIFGGRIVKR